MKTILNFVSLLFLLSPAFLHAEDCYVFVQYPSEIDAGSSSIDSTANSLINSYLSKVKPIPSDGISSTACLYEIDFQDYKEGYLIIRGPDIDSSGQSNYDETSLKFRQALLRAIFNEAKTPVKSRMCDKEKQYLSQECKTQLTQSSTYDRIQNDLVIRALKKEIEKKDTEILQALVKRKRQEKKVRKERGKVSKVSSSQRKQEAELERRKEAMNIAEKEFKEKQETALKYPELSTEEERKEFRSKKNEYLLFKKALSKEMRRSVSKTKGLVKVEQKFADLTKEVNDLYSSRTKIRVQILKAIAKKKLRFRAESNSSCSNLTALNCKNLSLANAKEDALKQANSVFSEFIPSTEEFRGLDAEEIIIPEIQSFSVLEKNWKNNDQNYFYAIDALVVGRISDDCESKIIANAPYLETNLPDQNQSYVKTEPAGRKVEVSNKKVVVEKSAVPNKVVRAKEPTVPAARFVGYNINIALVGAQTFTVTAKSAFRDREIVQMVEGAGFGVEAKIFPSQTKSNLDGLAIGFAYFIGAPTSLTFTDSTDDTSAFSSAEQFEDDTTSDISGTMSAGTVSVHYQWFWDQWSAHAGGGIYSSTLSYTLSQDTSADSEAGDNQRTLNIAGTTLDVGVNYVFDYSVQLGLALKIPLSGTASGSEVEKYEAVGYTVEPRWGIAAIQLGFYF